MNTKKTNKPVSPVEYKMMGWTFLRQEDAVPILRALRRRGGFAVDFGNGAFKSEHQMAYPTPTWLK